MLIIRSWQFFRTSRFFLCDDGKLETFLKKNGFTTIEKELETWDERWSELACVKLDQWKTKLNMNIKWLHWFMITEYYSRNDSTWPFGWGCGTIIVLWEIWNKICYQWVHVRRSLNIITPKYWTVATIFI